MTEAHRASERDISVARLMTIAIGVRIVVDTSIQMFGPFLPIIAGGLGTNVVVLGRLVGLRSAMGLFSPLFGAAADRHSYRRVMQLGLLFGAAGMAVIGLSNGLWLAALGMILSGLCFAAFVPTLQAYVSARLPYSRRARGLGILEYSWAITGILGLFLIGQVIEYGGWRVPFFVLAVGMLLGAIVFGMLPSARRSAEDQAEKLDPRSSANLVHRLAEFFRLGDNARSAYGAMGITALNLFAAVQFMIIYGAWFNGEYGLSASRLGVVALIFGLFDLTASVSVSLFTDSIGKWRSVLIGSLGALTGYFLIPWFNVSIVSAVLALAVTRGFFEFAIVANLPLLSEQAPSQRGKVMTLSAAFSLGAVTIANFTGPWLYTEYSVAAVAMVSLAAAIAGLILLFAVVREPSV